MTPTTTDTTRITGVLPVVQTPFADDGSIDVEALQAELEWVLDQGVDGLTTGMVSEILRLSFDERNLLSELVCATARARGRAAVISCGAESLRTAVMHANHAEEHHATALMANTPVTVGIDDSEVHVYFTEILRATELPVVVQDASGYVGRPLSIAVQTQLFEEFGDRVLFKPEAQPIGPRLSLLRDATSGQARILEGSGGAAVIDSYRRGIVGTMPGAEVCWAIKRLWDAVVEGDWETAYGISGPLNTLVAMQTTVDGYVAIEKHLLWRQGVLGPSTHRRPTGFMLDSESAAEVDRLFDQIAIAAGQPHRMLLAEPVST
ncbi:MAG: dihydrodipicolinate synthase family protein [Actinomycetales bacterium]|nr:dihydrodipicolinate synthase family protein [Actinomycetales bacterium]